MIQFYPQINKQEEMKKPKYLLNMISIFVPTTTTAF